MARQPGSSPPPSIPAADRLLPWLVVLFVGSGCAALIYEIIWFQLLALVIGSSAVSLGVLLGTFMGGMCLGSVLLPRFVSPARHPLKVYAVLELGIAIAGVVILLGMPALGQVYAALGGHGPAAIVVRGIVAAICLLPPTLLMGATLPAVARWVEASPRGVAWLGFFYGGNIAGAVCGCLLAGYYLLRVYDMAVATFVAAGINTAVALVALALAARASHILPTTRSKGTSPADSPRPTRWSPYVAIALSGCCALGAEVIWTRLLSLLLGGTVYTFSLILAVFLFGLGVGSSAGAFAGRQLREPRLALGVCQFLLVAAIAWTAWLLSKSMPYWPINPTLAINSWDALQLDILRCAWAVLPAAVLWGASFPLALASVATPGQDGGRLVGGVYAANTIGAILGAVAFSLMLVGSLGTQDCQRLLMLGSMIAALLALVPALWSREGQPHNPLVGAVGVLIGVLVSAVLVRSVPTVSSDLIAYGRNSAIQAGEGAVLELREGMNASIAVTQLTNGVRNFHVSGKIEASSEPQDMRLQRMLGHLPALVHPEPKSVLIVGCGAGVTAGSFTDYPSVKRIVICEIEPLIPQVVARQFHRENHDVASEQLRKKGLVEIVYDDARHFILTTDEKFDIITSDPINPWVKGAATLYTEEYLELCKSRLNPGGVVTQWVPLYETNAAAVKSELATFFRVFPAGTVWSNDVDGFGYDVVLLAANEPMTIDVEQVQLRLDRVDHTLAMFALAEVGFPSATDLLATYAASGADLTRWLADAQINRDRNLRLQYLAGLGANRHDEGQIHLDLMAHRTYPEKLFVVSPDDLPIFKRRLGFKP